MPSYKKVILASGPEILSVRNPVRNEGRRYIAGLDPVEAWDARMMSELNIPLQSLSPDASAHDPRVPSVAPRTARTPAHVTRPQAGLAAAQG
jgi:hypothetical protein